MLRVIELEKRFGGLSAVSKVSFDVERGDVVGIIGPNGSGKTTLLNVINGFYRPDSGRVVFDGRRIDDRPPSKIAKLGVSRTFQVPKLFGKMTVLENLLIPALSLGNGQSMAGIESHADEILEMLGLVHIKHSPARALSGGQQKLVEFARALMAEPKLLLLDEPFAALHPVMRSRMAEVIQQLYRASTTFLIVSHEISAVTKVSKRLIVMSNGSIIAEGEPRAVIANLRVIESYLGGAGSIVS